jgi:hypothetical protein
MVRTGDSTEVSGVSGPAAFSQLMRLERQAVEMLLNQPLFVPGLFQVHGYATEMIGRVAGLKPGDRDLIDRVNQRMERAAAFRKRLAGAEPPQVWVAIDEGALRRAVGGREIMREQLDHLATMSDFGTVHLAVVPLAHGAHPGLSGSFEVHQTAGGEASVFLEGPHADEIVERDPSLVQRCRETMETVMASAVSAAEARALLATISGEL